jgi:TM2 domain
MSQLIPKPRNYLTNLWLSIILGTVGADKFYQRDGQKGYLKLISIGGLGIWWLCDVYKNLKTNTKNDNQKLNETDKFNKMTMIQTIIISFLLILVFIGFCLILKTNFISPHKTFAITDKLGFLSLLMQIYIVFFFYALALEIVLGVIFFLIFTLIDSLRQKKYVWFGLNFFSTITGLIFINAYYYFFVRIHKTKGIF